MAIMPSSEITSLASGLKDLERLVSPSMGPFGADKIVETDAKAILVTNNGSDLLEVLSPTTAMLTLVIKSIKEFVHSHGDGSKRLVVLISQGLQEAQAASLMPLIQGLSALQSHYVEQVADQVALSMQLVVNIPKPVDTIALHKVLSALLATHMVNKVGSRAAQHLASLLSELVCNRLVHAGSESRAWDVMQLLQSKLPLCLVPGGLVTSSRLIPGIVLRQSLTSPHMYRTLERCSGIRFVLLGCSLDAADGHSSTSGAQANTAAVEMHTEQELRAAAHAHQQTVRQRLQFLSGRGVNLLLCTQPASALLSFLCIEAEVALISGIEEDDARSICSAAHVFVTDSAGEKALQSASVGEAVSCYRLPLGNSSSGMVLQLAPHQGVSTLLLSAPSDGLCRQYAKLVQSGMKVLAAAVVPSVVTAEGTQDKGDERQLATATPASGEPGANTDSRLALLPGGAAFDAGLAVQLERAVQMLKGNSTSNLLCGDILVQLLQRHPVSELLPAAKVLHAMALAVPMALAKTGAQELSSCPGSNPGSLRCRRSALLQVHELVAAHREACHGEWSRSAGLLHVGATCSSMPEAASALGLETPLEQLQNSGPRLMLANPAAHGVLEAKSVLLSLWSHAVSLLIQTLRIDGVVAASSRKIQGTISLPSHNAKGSSAARKGFHELSSEDESATSDGSSPE